MANCYTILQKMTFPNINFIKWYLQMSNKFTLSDIKENPLLGLALNNEYYKQALEDILANANTVDSDKPEPIICFLLMKACENYYTETISISG
jgi:hypothetical protein